MRPQEYMKLIWELEQECKLETWWVGEAHLWPVVRFQLANALRKKGEATGRGVFQDSPRGGRKLWQAMQAQRKAEQRDAEHNADATQRADVLVLHHSAYRSPAGGVFYDRLLDYLREEIARRGITSLGLEYCPSGAFRTPRALPSRYIQSELHIGNLRNRLLCMLGNADAGQTEHYQAVSELVDRNGIAASWLAPQQLARQAGLLNRWADMFTRYLKSSGAKLALTTYYYSMEGMALCLAAWRLGIPCVDVQHGVQGRYHFAYGPWQCAPEGGYNTLPAVYWCWDKESAAQINEWAGAQGARAIVGGNPWTALWEGADTPAAKRELERINSAIAAQPERKHILLSLQWDAGLTEGLRELIQASPENWHWWVRPHPVQAGGRDAVAQVLEQITPKRYELEIAADAPLPLLLRCLDAHVTRSSTVVQEAAQAGLHSLVLDAAARDHYGAELDSGMATAAEKTEDALAALAAILEKPRAQAQDHSQRLLVSKALDALMELAGLDAGKAAPA